MPTPTFLIDASGVLYNDHGVIPGVADTIRSFQRNGNTIIVTNNSNNYVTTISSKLAASDIHIPPSHIISSGSGLRHDSEINSKIKNKAIFVFGRDDSHQYILDAGASRITDTIHTADALVLTASLKSNTKEYLAPIIAHLNDNIDMPVICANPDRYIMGIEGLFPVMGFYADHVEQSINRPIYWIGKPEQNFSKVVDHVLRSEHSIIPDQNCIFFDDNYKNVIRLMTDLNISGTWVQKTGLGKDYSDKEVNDILNAHPGLNAIDSLANAKTP